MTSTQGTILNALEIEHVLENVISFMDAKNLLKCRFVCHKWNTAVIRVVKKSQISFPIPIHLRYAKPRSLKLKHARRWAVERFTNLMDTFNSSTALPFDTLVIDRDFYLAGVMPELVDFLDVHGEFIRHLKFHIRCGREPEENENHVTDCPQVVSRENLRVIFRAVTNLESLDFSIRFTQYGSEERADVKQRMFPEIMDMNDLPQLQKLTKITIQEPHRISYVRGFLKEILGMAPNLTTLFIKWANSISAFASVLNALPHLHKSLRTFGIRRLDMGVWGFRFQEFDFSLFQQLTCLELHANSVHPPDGTVLLQNLHSSLTTLILGNRRKWHSHTLGIGTFEWAETKMGLLVGQTQRQMRTFAFPPVMENLKIMHVNLLEFPLPEITCYASQFPALEYLTFGCCEVIGLEWTYAHLQHLLPGELGQSQTLKSFYVFSPIRQADLDTIGQAVRSTFPVAQFH